MICFHLFLLFLLFNSCSTMTSRDGNQDGGGGDGGVVVIKEYKIHPGEVVKIRIPLPDEPDEHSERGLYCDGKKIIAHKEGDHGIAYVAESYFSKRDQFDCIYGHNLVAKLFVEKKEYPREILNVAKEKVTLSPKDLKRAIREKKLLKKIYKNPLEHSLFEESFQRPLESKITSIYGTKRIFNNRRETQHLGTDFRAPIGIPVPVANSGKVVLVRNLFFTGKTVIVDHGMNIFTIYAHLSKLKTREGEHIAKNSIIGLAGNTGRVTGPHLHWGVKVQGHFVDGLSLIQTSQ